MKTNACVTNQLIIIAIVLSFSAILICLTGCSAERKPEPERSIFVSIPPQKLMVQQIAGDLFDVDYLVQPGHSPATYEPSLAQMEDLSGAELFFRIGVPFEEIWVHRIRDINPEIKIIDVRDSISLQPLDDYQTLIDKSLMSPHAGEKDHGGSSDDHDHTPGLPDPHIWMSPELIKTQVQTIHRALISFAPDKKDVFDANLSSLLTDLTDLQSEIKATLADLSNRKFLIFHPALGYYADEFDLEQIPIEIEGKSPSIIELSGMIAYANHYGIKVIFIQSQFSTREAEIIAESIKGRVVKLDPLLEDYLSNLKEITLLMKSAMEQISDDIR